MMKRLTSWYNKLNSFYLHYTTTLITLIQFEVGEESITQSFEVVCEPSQNHHQLNATDEDDALYYGLVPRLGLTIDWAFWELISMRFVP